MWCADYKGEFVLADRRYCYPLTISDFASRYLIACDALSTTKDAYAFDDFIACFNNERPHQALDMEYPAELYAPSTRPYRGLGELDDPFHDKTVTVTHCGRICFNRRKVNLSSVFAGQNVGIKEVSDRIWLVSFMQYDLGYFDHETCRLESVDNPFRVKVLPMSPV